MMSTGNVTKMSHGDSGSVTTMSHSDSGNVTKMSHGDSGSVTKMSHGDSGNVTKMSHGDSGSVTTMPHGDSGNVTTMLQWSASSLLCRSKMQYHFICQQRLNCDCLLSSPAALVHLTPSILLLPLLGRASPQ